MSITDELRDYTKRFLSQRGWDKHRLTVIADRIDAEHERLMQEQPFTIDMVPMTDESMAEHGWVRLPKDADGEYIRIGDVMEGEKIGGGYGEPFEVVGYIMSNGELEPMDEHKCPRKRKYLRHHHAPTVEDVLTEFAWVLVGKREFDGDVAEAISEYAAKLRLAEGEDA